MSTISGKVKTTVHVGFGRYGSPLTITNTGSVAPTGVGAIAVYENGTSYSVTNYGHITGGTGPGGSPYYVGGTGVLLLAGQLSNFGVIAGGQGGNSGSETDHGTGGTGGTGAYLSGGALTNSNLIIGGAGGGSVGDPGSTGGVGVDVAGGALTNYGSIVGGSGGKGGSYYNSSTGYYVNEPGGTGGAGVEMSGGDLANRYQITGGTGGTSSYFPGGTGGAGVEMTGGTLTNQYQISGGAGGLQSYASGGLGGAGVILQADVVTGTTPALINDAGCGITGGNGSTGSSDFQGGYPYGGNGGAGGAGVILAAGSLTNFGTIDGGNGGTGSEGFASRGSALGLTGGAGGTGVAFYKGSLTNSGAAVIRGGNGGVGGDGWYGADGSGGPYGAGGLGGVGGTGLEVDGPSLTNAAQIVGGNGGNGGNGAPPYYLPIYGSPGGNGGAGGVGVVLYSGSLTNQGAIGGGNGGIGGLGGAVGIPGGSGGNGGAGVYLDGGTLINAGTISGGSGGDGTEGSANGVAGAAVQFGATASTLIVDPGAVFNGQVTANTAVKDLLKLAGTQAGGTAITLGEQFTGFSTLEFAAGAAWTVDATTGAAAAHGGMTIDGFASGDKIDITNLTPTQVAADFNPNTHVLKTTTDGTLRFNGGFGGEQFLLWGEGGGTDMTLAHDPITTTVTLGTASYPSPLTVTATGVVAPTAAGATGVYSDLTGNSLTNFGSIQGGAGIGGTGGLGVNFKAAGTLTNGGGITGGTGAATFVGGAGVDLAAGTLTNTGHISGGIGGSGATGGNGVSLYGATLLNSGSITGGAGGAGGKGDAGVYLDGGTLTNSGSIIGGTGGSNARGGGGVFLKAGTLTNTGSITGGSGSGSGGGWAGVVLNGGTLVTSGTISGGQGGTAGGAAGDALLFEATASTLMIDPRAVFNGQVAANASVTDVLELSGKQAAGTPITLGTQFTGFSTVEFDSGAAWTVNASTGAATSHGLAIDGFAAGDELDISNLMPAQVEADFNPTTHVLSTTGDGTFDFSGSFAGEQFLLSGDGGVGTDITLANDPITATIRLGSTAYPSSSLTITRTGAVAPTAAGAAGVVSDLAGDSLTNEGAIQGAVGTAGSTGGSGGAGANFNAAGTLTLTNTGSIRGGAGGAGTTKGGAGGTGVVIDGGTLTTSGTIAGGAGGSGGTAGAAGDAVKFGAAASTLMVDPGATFDGQVVANAAVNDALELSGTQSGGTAITLGAQFTNFSTLEFATGASATVAATKAALTVSGHALKIDGFALGDTLDITNLTAKGTTLNFNSATEVLTLTHGTTMITLDFNSAFTGDHFVLTANASGTDLTLATGAALTAGANATFASLGRDIMNFVSDYHRELTDSRFVQNVAGMHSALTSPAHADTRELGVFGHALHGLTDYGLTHAGFGGCKA
jgi:hypothetical protein